MPNAIEQPAANPFAPPTRPVVPSDEQALAFRREHRFHEVAVVALGWLMALHGLFLGLTACMMLSLWSSGLPPFDTPEKQSAMSRIVAMVGVEAVTLLVLGPLVRLLRPIARLPSVAALAMMAGISLTAADTLYDGATTVAPAAIALYLLLSRKGATVLSKPYRDLVESLRGSR